MQIIKNYTGNPLLNNSIQTIESLAELDHVSEITTEVLEQLYQKHKLWELFKRMKSYTMLFSKNGPLLNDKDFGERIFKGIIEFTLKHFENKGKHRCEISGLRFDTSFTDIYEKVLALPKKRDELETEINELNQKKKALETKQEKESETLKDDLKKLYDEIKKKKNKVMNLEKSLAKKDKTINRCWFPLIGSLGSDAQALPQAVFDIKIHPICLVIIQFLPFSALLYKGGVLLLDSINFDFSKEFISENTKKVLERIELCNNKKIENIKDLSQGDYILQAIRIYQEKSMDYESYTDLNLWSFSNSGTGASCEIDRIPNEVFKTLYQIYRTGSECQRDLKKILTDSYSAKFLECLIEGRDYYGLYPRKIQVKKGKKTETIELEGVSVTFFEAYQKAIDNNKLKDYAKYIAYLISEDKDKDLKPDEIRLLEELEPYKKGEYYTLVYGVLLRAAQNGQWSLQNHLEILNETDEKTIQSWISGIFKMVHFYFYKRSFSEKCLILAITKLTPILSTIIHLIETDEKADKSIGRLRHQQDYSTFNINQIFVRQSQRLSFSSIVDLTYDEHYARKNGLNILLRLYFNQAEATLEFKEEYLSAFNGGNISEDDNSSRFKYYKLFAETYQTYYLEKYNQDIAKYKKHVLKAFPKTSTKFRIWMYDALEKMKDFYKGNLNFDKSSLKSFEEELFYAPNGEFNLSFSQFAIEFLLNQQFLKSFPNN